MSVSTTQSIARSVGGIALLLVSCADGTGPSIGCPAAAVPLCSLDAPALAAARLDLEDANERIVARLEDTGAKAELARWLANLNSNVGVGAVTHARSDLGEALASVARAHQRASSFPGDQADLSAIELELDFVKSLIDP